MNKRALTSLAAGVLLSCGRREAAKPAPQYVDAAACSGCHAEIAKTYALTGMARSFYRPRPDRMTEAWGKTYYHKASDRFYTMTERDGRYYQRREQAGLVVEKEVHYVVGSGIHARSYLYRNAEGKLAQMPVTWYRFWAMSPGYDRANHQDFRREITDDCLFCHNGYSVQGRLAEGIDCQRCHGPGSEHVASAGKGPIVNPAKLGRERQLEVCMQCHLETTSRRLPYSVRRYEREPFSYRAGEPLSDFILHFDHAPGTGQDDKFEIAHHAYRLRRSLCFQKSEMTCTTCHDPHSARARPTCAGCHPSAHRAGDDCLACHMPKRRTNDVVHVVMTDHYIQRHKPARNLLAPLAEEHDTEETQYRGEVVPYYPAAAGGELYAAVAQVVEGSNVEKGTSRLERAIAERRPAQAEFYYELAEAYWKTGRGEDAVRMYREALRRKPGLAAAERNLAVSLSRLGRLEEAETVLRAAAPDAAALSNLGEVLLLRGKKEEAAQVLRKAIEKNPDLPEAWNNLGEALGSEEAFREAIRRQPDDAVAHNNLANLLVRKGDFAQAERHFARAIRENPKYAAARYNYGVALGERKRLREAQGQLEAAVRLNPKLAEAHNNLGIVLAMQGELGKAIASWRKALEIRPDLDEARRNLQLAEGAR